MAPQKSCGDMGELKSKAHKSKPTVFRGYYFVGKYQQTKGFYTNAIGLFA